MADGDAAIDRRFQLFGGDARMGPIDARVLERLRRMAEGGSGVAAKPALPRRRLPRR